MKIACVLLPDFEASIELRRRPGLAGRPVVVGGLPHERKGVLSRSPEAAARGVAAGMPLRRAHGLCPEAVFLPPDEELYREAFARVLRVLDSFSPKVEISFQPSPRPSPKGRGGQHHSSLITHHSSLLYLDASGLELLFGPDEELGRRMAVALEREVGLRPRVGLGSGKFVAEMAARSALPGSALVVREGEERSFLAPLPVEHLPCSRETLRRLWLFGLRTVGQLATLPAGSLAEQFGPEGVETQRLARGIDERTVVAREVPVLLEEEMEIDPPADDGPRLLSVASALLDRLLVRLQVSYLTCREVSLHLGFSDGSTASLSTTLHQPTSRKEELLRAVERLMRRDAETGRRGDGGTGRRGDGETGGCSITALGLRHSKGGKPCHAEQSKASLRNRRSFAIAQDDNGGVQEDIHQALWVTALGISLSGFGGDQGEQLGLFRSRVDDLKRVWQALRQAEEQFGEKSIYPLEEVAGEKPPAIAIGVVPDPAGSPSALLLEGRWERVREVCNRWRVVEDWWRREIAREYYRVITENGRLCVVFKDLTPLPPFPAREGGKGSPFPSEEGRERARGHVHGGVRSTSSWFLERIYA